MQATMLSRLSILSLLVGACGGSLAESNDAAPAEAPVSASAPPPSASATVTAPPTCANEQIVPRPTMADDAATYASFLARSGTGWNAAPPDATWDMVLGRIEFSWRTDAKGAKLAAISRADAEVAARAFVTANWDLLGYRSESAAAHASTSAIAVDASYSGGGFAWSVHVDSDEPQAGYEAIDFAVQHLHFNVDVADDGTVRQFASAADRRVPTLTLSAMPVIDLDAARAEILGQPMQQVAGPYEPAEASFDYGPIGSGDIVATGLALTFDVQASVTRFRLAHAFTIAHERYHAILFVDACTGKRLGS